jgi:hypothetical protein
MAAYPLPQLAHVTAEIAHSAVDRIFHSGFAMRYKDMDT